MLVAEKPDAVCLNVPPPVTAALACQVLRLGYPLLLEKPPGLTAEEVDAMIAAAGETGAPNMVAFNRRYLPLLAHLRERLEENFEPAQVQRIQVDFSRVNRADPDFSTTAIHGIDTARFLARSDYAQVSFHYQDIPSAGPGVANLFLDCTFRCGTTAGLTFLPLSGLVAERYTVHCADHSFFASTPLWKGSDFPGSLLHLQKGSPVEQVSGFEAAGVCAEEMLSAGSGEFLLNGFYQENATFFDAIRAGRRPAGDIQSGRQAVLVAEAIRERRAEIRFD